MFLFLAHYASVDCVNSDSCSEVMTKSGHVFFCATTVVCKRYRLYCKG